MTAPNQFPSRALQSNIRRPSCPYANSKTLREILTGKGKTNSHGSVKLRSPLSLGKGGVLPFAGGQIWLMGVPTAHPFWARAPLVDRCISPVDQGSRGVAIVGILIDPPSCGTPWLPPGTFPIKYSREDARSWETPSPGILPFPGTHPGVPPLICRPYVVFSLHKHDFVGVFEKRGHKNVRNKI